MSIENSGKSASDGTSRDGARPTSRPASELLEAVASYLDDAERGEWNAPLMNGYAEWCPEFPLEDVFPLDRSVPGRGLRVEGSQRADWLWQVEEDLPIDEWPVLRLTDEADVTITHANLGFYLQELATEESLTYLRDVIGLADYDAAAARTALDAARARWAGELPEFA